MIGTILFGAFSMVFCILFCIFRAKKANVLSLALKTISSVCFILCGIFAIKTMGSNNVNLLIIAGLVLGLIGDIILDLKIMYPDQGNQYFIVGTSSFAIGHVFYFLAVLFYNTAVVPAIMPWNILICIGVAIVLTLGIMLPSKKLGLNFGKMIYIVALYSFILTFMMAYAISIAIFNPIFWIFAVGMIVFFLSDLVLSLQYFGGNTSKSLIYVNHILYYAAQILIAISVLFITIA
ncbi:MAG: lysoplasmalogenase [Clostridia bacterium]|nr:lysoplasmalogenase [Clostridia bacterium]